MLSINTMYQCLKKWNDMVERDWTEMFQVEPVRTPLNVEVGDCGANCQLAKELKCVCKCGGRNHGAALKQNVRSLDEFENEPNEDPETFEPEEYLQELAILA